MKILSVGDLHGQCVQFLDYLKKNPVDLIIITGDITHFGPLELAEDILNEVCLFDAPVLAIPGNCDPEGIHGKIENSRAINLHGKSTKIKNIGICGFGGSNPTPFNTPLEFEEIEIYHELSKAMEQIKDDEVQILITHMPPFGTKADIVPSGDHVGSKSLREIIEKYQPSLNICGHIHESRAIDKIGDTVVINPGELSEGFACLINIDESDDDLKIDSKIIDLKSSSKNSSKRYK
ncbi:MAG: metallophosphoesterase [Euryarchaeota archaeon]|nr:metallophosphoesterase [Euryarchaeota archaeon]